jgi:DNA-binding transcriptional ArsR family regulator
MCGHRLQYTTSWLYSGAIENALPYPLPEALVGLIAERFRVLGEPMRIRLLDQLRAGEATVQSLADSTDTSQQNVSKHLGVLLHAGVVGRRKDGTFVYYRIVDEGVFDLCEQVCGSVRGRLTDLEAILEAAGR